MFKGEFSAEWTRFNPKHVKPGDGLWATFVGAARETVPGFFAPLRMLWWVMLYAARRLSKWARQGNSS